jgi:gamma-glutamyltranspeptidase/glutathione hydrolase
MQNWGFAKPAVESSVGIVVAQHRAAAEVGARILAAGGNAVDAAVATGFAVGVLEPWMSGIGGGGYMLVAPASGEPVQCVDFGMVAPAALDPADYPLVGGIAPGSFDWPAVAGDRNLKGPLSVAVPGHVEGMRAASERFGRLAWKALLQPAIEIAAGGLPIDWFAGLAIAIGARELAEFPEARRVYLPDGLPPMPEWSEGPPARLPMGALGATLGRIAEAGARDFYEGELAAKIVGEMRRLGGKLAAADFVRYRAKIEPAGVARYRDAEVVAPTGLNAGPTLHRTLALLADSLPAGERAPGPAAYAAYAAALDRAYAERFATMGDRGERAAGASCTTHISVVDRDGMMVALTQTLLSRFGSKVLLADTGILLNNGIMWFDPRPGLPNSIAAGKRPLSNMVPTVIRKAGRPWAALGASGGRRILPAVAQLVSFLVDYGMTLEAALHRPRLDASGAGVTLDERLPEVVRRAMPGSLESRAAALAVYPVLFASPNAVLHDPATARNTGMADIVSPWSGAAAESPASGRGS